MNSNQPSPILQKAASEIQDILKKYDIGGHIILASKEHGEYLMHFPTWSKAQFEFKDGKPHGIRFMAKGKDEDKTIASTVHMLQVFEQTSENLANGMVSLIKMISTKAVIEGGPQRL